MPGCASRGCDRLLPDPRLADRQEGIRHGPEGRPTRGCWPSRSEAPRPGSDGAPNAAQRLRAGASAAGGSSIAAMQAAPPRRHPAAGNCSSAASSCADELPELSRLQRERLPDYADWWRQRGGDRRADGRRRGHPAATAILAQHPLRLLGPPSSAKHRPPSWNSSPACTGRERGARGPRGGPGRLRRAAEHWQTLATRSRCWRLRRQRGVPRAAGAAGPAGRRRASPPGASRALVRQLAAASEALARGPAGDDRTGARSSRRDEVAVGHRAGQGARGELLSRGCGPAWWRLRKVLNARYDFARPCGHARAGRRCWRPSRPSTRPATQSPQASGAVARGAAASRTSLDEVAAQVRARRGAASRSCPRGSPRSTPRCCSRTGAPQIVARAGGRRRACPGADRRRWTSSCSSIRRRSRSINCATSCGQIEALLRHAAGVPPVPRPARQAAAAAGHRVPARCR